MSSRWSRPRSSSPSRTDQRSRPQLQDRHSEQRKINKGTKNIDYDCSSKIQPIRFESDEAPLKKMSSCTAPV